MAKPVITKYAICSAITEAQIQLTRFANNTSHSDPEYKAGMIEGIMLMYEHLIATLEGLEDAPTNANEGR